MPRKPKKPCRHPGCPELTEDRFCCEHQKEYDRQYNKYKRDPESNKRYGRSWKRIRNRYIKAHPFCELCLKEGRYTPAEHVHHRTELSDGGGHDWDNLCSLCRQHHSSLHLKERSKRNE